MMVSSPIDISMNYYLVDPFKCLEEIKLKTTAIKEHMTDFISP
jgi:hypothetical protein